MINNRFVRYVTIVFISQAFVFLIISILDHELTLLNYVNRSFYVASFFLLISLAIFTVSTGFFDIVTRSFRLIFAGKDITRENVDEMRPLSTIFNFNYSPIFIIGVSNLFLSLLALLIYYY